MSGLNYIVSLLQIAAHNPRKFVKQILKEYYPTDFYPSLFYFCVKNVEDNISQILSDQPELAMAFIEAWFRTCKSEDLLLNPNIPFGIVWEKTFQSIDNVFYVSLNIILDDENLDAKFSAYLTAYWEKIPTSIKSMRDKKQYLFYHERHDFVKLVSPSYYARIPLLTEDVAENACSLLSTPNIWKYNTPIPVNW